MTTDYVHGSTDARERQRLEHMARFVARWSLAGFRGRPGQRVLDLGCGVGAMTGELLARCAPGAAVVGVELQHAALRAARAARPGAAFVRGDAARLPFADAAFDWVHGSWILEHLADPLVALGEAHRVLRPSGRCLFLEVDNATFRTVPPIPEADAVLAELSRRQLAGGGDPYVGRSLGGLLARAGFAAVDARPVAVVGTAADPAGYRDFNRVFVEIVESVAGFLGPAWAPTLRRAADGLRRLPDLPGSEQHFRPVLATATR